MQVESSQKGDEERGRSRRKDPRGDGGEKHKLKNKEQVGQESTAWTEVKLPELNTTLEEIWEEVILTGEIPAPPNLGREPVPGRKSHEFCRYHRFHGHHTKSCRSIRKIILRLIKQGKLAHYIDRKETSMIACHNRQAKESRERRRLGYNFIAHSRVSFQDFEDNVLSRVYKVDHEGNEIMNSPKEEPLEDWKNREIYFSPKDVPEGEAQHMNSLVISLAMARIASQEGGQQNKEVTWAVDKILIDKGSSVDVLFYHTFRALGYEDSDLLPSAYTLYGFNGVATRPKGEVCLKILAGELEAKVTLCVVDVESPYNALIGRPWIHGIKGVASTYHQMIRFPMPSGIGEIREAAKKPRTATRKMLIFTRLK
ncbi:uncharacterized protein LOC113271825 [Papaver somniferum]|uniref:uncharacterized protein LOC113271825 n=1 Tax=Papaver somniferum TaxID=3469 RepID=UPI000E6F5D0B|nr:uncharacterized protein LOC113271825 [Papaver somniferum]